MKVIPFKSGDVFTKAYSQAVQSISGPCWDYKLHIGDVVMLTNSRAPHMVCQLDGPLDYAFKVRLIHEDKRKCRIKRITRWDLKSVDTFLTAAYKANASAR